MNHEMVKTVYSFFAQLTELELTPAEKRRIRDLMNINLTAILADEKETFVLSTYEENPNPLQTIKIVKDKYGLGLREAKELVEEILTAHNLFSRS